MIVYLHGFNWEIYTQSIMPAFMQWLLDGNEETIYQLYQQTRCAHEELFLPPVMHQICTWARAQACARRLPQGQNIRHEYEIICSPERFTAISDNYDYHHYPMFYQNVDGLRAIWNALITEYCQFNLAQQEKVATQQRHDHTADKQEQQTPFWLFVDDAMDLVNPFTYLAERLAHIAPEALTLFEYLACERRAMPFGYCTGSPYENCIGYLTPSETQRLFLYLQRGISPKQSISTQQRNTLKLVTKSEIQEKSNTDIIENSIQEQITLLLGVVRLATEQKVGLISSCD